MPSNLTLYIQAAGVVQDFLTARGSLKNLCYARSIVNKPATLALVQQTLKFRSFLCDVLELAQFPGFSTSDVKKYKSLMEKALAAEVSSSSADVDHGDDDDESDGIRIVSKWHSTRINVYPGEYNKITSAANARALKEDPSEFGQYVPRPGKTTPGVEYDMSSSSSSSTSPTYSFTREAVLVLAYDLMFNGDLPRFPKSQLDAAAVATENASRFSSTTTSTSASTSSSKSAASSSSSYPQGPALAAIPDTHGIASASKLFTLKPPLMWSIAERRALGPISTLSPSTKSSQSTATDPTKSSGSTKDANNSGNDNINGTSGDTGGGWLAGVCIDEFVPGPDWSFKQRAKAYHVLLCRNRGIDVNDKEAILPEALRNLYERKNPRYVRVNTLKVSMEQAHSKLAAAGYKLLSNVPAAFVLPHSADAASKGKRENSTEKTKPSTTFNNYNSFNNNNDRNNEGEEFKSRQGSFDAHHGKSRSNKSSSGSSSRSGSGGGGDVDAAKAREELVYWEDPVVPYLLCFMPNDQTIIRHSMVLRSHELIIQDKASCFPPVALSPAPKSDVLDGCSAPGNKTSFLAALMKNKGTLFASELNPRRARLMSNRLSAAGVTNCDVIVKSFFTLDPQDPKFAKVKYILLDPSCSGSGNPSMDVLLANDGLMHAGDSKHVKSLCDFQVSIVSHGLQFPALEKLVYSTCSVYPRENEAVVARILGFIKANNLPFELVPVMQNWPYRGWKQFPLEDLGGLEQPVQDTEQAKEVLQSVCVVSRRSGTVDFSAYADKCARVDPSQHDTGGFFVACFQRVAEREAVEEEEEERSHGEASEEVSKSKSKAKSKSIRVASFVGDKRKSHSEEESDAANALGMDPKSAPIEMKKKKKKKVAATSET